MPNFHWHCSMVGLHRCHHKITTNDMATVAVHLTTTKQNKAHTTCLILGMYYTSRAKWLVTQGPVLLRFNPLRPSDVYMRPLTISYEWVRYWIVACLVGTKPLSELMLGYCQLGTNFIEISIEVLTCLFKEMHLKTTSAKRWPFCFKMP